MRVGVRTHATSRLRRIGRLSCGLPCRPCGVTSLSLASASFFSAQGFPDGARVSKTCSTIRANGSTRAVPERARSEAEELAEPVERPAAAAAAVLLRAEREELAEGAREVLKNCSSSLE